MRVLRQQGLRQAARAVLDAREASPSADAFEDRLAALRVALVVPAPTSSPTDCRRPPRDTKQAQVLAMLTRNEDASGATDR
jgi:hypothetical protein